MPTVVLFDPEAPIPLQTRWALMLGRARQEEFTLLVPAKESEPARATALAQVRNEVGRFDGYTFVEGEGAAQPGDGQRGVRCTLFDPARPLLEVVKTAFHEADATFLAALLHRSDARDAWTTRLAQEVLPKFGGAVAVVRMASEVPEQIGQVLVPAARTRASLSAIRLAAKLVGDNGKVVPVYVEPPIGIDAESVGHRELEHIVANAVGDERERMQPAVVIDADVVAGVTARVKATKPDVVLIGTTTRAVLGNRFHATISGRLCRQIGDVAVVVLRDPLPVGHRLRSLFEGFVQRHTPQLDRDTRLELTRRVQSNSAWNFDFVALISLATLIAAMGLLQNSAAVIIGAMLVAPLMTPILGLGLALVQGNSMLARLALRTIGLGVSTAFLLALLVGFVDGHFVMTGEMLGRGWPGIIDLMVAFISGLAAAYASSRPGLFSALPGVAIAAALVPPIATSGLAASRLEWQIAYGAFLLFFTNMVAIVLAASVSLWAVGVRSNRDEVRWLRHLGNGFLVLSIVLAFHLGGRTHVGGEVPVPNGCRTALAARLPADVRLVDLSANLGDGHVLVTMRVGASVTLDGKLTDALAPIAAAHFEQEVRLRLVHEWEAIGRAAPR